ncbi:MAG: TetR/AcrR family transcriptional regulator [Actinomycetes bacterium]
MPTTTWERLDPRRRNAVLRAAEAEFGACGFSHGSLNVIAREAGVAKGSLFQYFEDKADLYSYVSDLASQRIRADMEAALPSLGFERGFWPALRRLTHVWVAYFDDHPLELAVTAAVNLEPDMAARSAVREAVNRHYIEVLRPLLEAAQGTGDIRADADLDTLLALLLLVLPHLALAAHSPGLDPLMGLSSPDPAVATSGIDRLVLALEHAFGPSVALPATSRDRR